MWYARSHAKGASEGFEPGAGGQRLGVNQSSLQLLAMWLVLRVLTGLWIALVSSLRPVTDLESRVALWPPSRPVGPWLERALLAPWLRWDTHRFVKIVSRGYRLDDGTAQFHPLLPWLATPLEWITGQPVLALLIVSSAAGIALLLAFERLASLDLEPEAARSSAALLLLSPFAFALFLPYTEGLFLLWAVLCLLWARKRSWWLAGFAGGVATLTRQQGVFLALPLIWEWWNASNRDVRRAVTAWKNWLPLALIPASLLAWLFYRAALGDLRANLDSPQTLIYSLIISPSATKVVPYQAFIWPWRALSLALEKLWNTPDADLFIDLVLAAYFLLLMVVAWRHMRVSYRIYTAAIVVASFAYHTGPYYPYMGLPRHLLLAFPVFIGLGRAVQRRWLRLSMATLGLLGFFFLLLMYGIEAWIP